MRRALVDPDAFYPLRNLVAGPFTDAHELAAIERFLRTVVLHDELLMELDPLPYDPASEDVRPTESESAQVRNVIVGFGPVLTGYDFFTERDKIETPDIALSPTLLAIARSFSNADKGNPYYEAHIELLKRIVHTVRQGGSALLAGEFGATATDASSKYPGTLFEALDRDWQEFAKEADTGTVGVRVPPVLSIVLTRSARRDAIPAVIKDIREEWATPRTRLWGLLDNLRTARALEEVREIKLELAAASRLLSPAQSEFDTQPVRVLWDLVVGGLAGASTATVAGTHPGIGAAIGAIGAAARSASSLTGELGAALFGRGAFDLARRLRRELLRTESDALARLLTEAEKSKLSM